MPSKAWKIGFLIILLFTIASELLLVFDDYVFTRIGIDRNIIKLIFWLTPMFAAYIATYYSKTNKLLMGLSYIILFPVIFTCIHYINGEFGSAVDFTGSSGALVVFKVSAAIGSIMIIIGTLLGLLFSKQKTSSTNEQLFKKL
ncbi:MAG: hypothetical protein OEY89_17480 [Gammaproteobacteria bacterium]|nr:hypothetical protein [Gammaproteobacteria bacterium]